LQAHTPRRHIASMNTQETPIREIILGGIIGDALGSPLEGLSRGHIRAVFKTIDSFVDPQPALKNKMQRWRKPGLYSSVSQMMLLCAIGTRMHKGKHSGGLPALLARLPAIEGDRSGILRHPSRAEKALVGRVLHESGGRERAPDEPCARAIPIAAPSALLRGDERDLCIEAARLCLHLSSDPSSIAGCIAHSLMLRKRAEAGREGTKSLLACAIEAVEISLTLIGEMPERYFDLGANPESLHSAAAIYYRIFNELSAVRDTESAEKIICAHAAPAMKNPPAYATADHPLCLLPFAVFISGTRPDPEELLFVAAAEGGSSSVMCSLCGQIAGAGDDSNWARGRLMRDLANKRRIAGIAGAISSGKITEAVLEDFLSAEASLTAKEIEEHAARNKHHPRSGKPAQSRGDAERRMAKAVAESWTKTDKARWKKEKSRYDKHRD